MPHGDAVCVKDNQGEGRREAIPGRTNIVTLGGKKRAVCSVDLLASGIIRAYTGTWGGMTNEVPRRQEAGEGGASVSW